MCDAALDQSKKQESALQKFVLGNITGSTRAFKDEEKRKSMASRSSFARKSFSDSRKSIESSEDVAVDMAAASIASIESAPRAAQQSDLSKTIEFTLPFESVKEFGGFFKSFGSSVELQVRHTCISVYMLIWVSGYLVV